MTLTELKYIIAVARERHFGRAAESCNISQPSLSVAVRKLEKCCSPVQLGCPRDRVYVEGGDINPSSPTS